MGIFDVPNLTRGRADQLYAPIGVSSTTALYAQLTRNPELLVAGTPTLDSNNAVISAPVVWPDGTTGTYTADVINSTFLSCVDAWHISYGSTKVYVQPLLTRNSIGIVTSIPAVTVTGQGDFTTGLKLRWIFDSLGLSDGAAVTTVASTTDSAISQPLTANATVSKQPTIKLADLSGHDTVRFVRASAQYLRTALLSAGDIIAQPATLCVVYKRASTAAAGNIVTGGVNASSVAQHMTLSAESASSQASISALNGGTVTSSIAADTSWHILTGVFDGTSSRVHIDGTVTTGTITNDVNGVLPRVTIGANPAASATYFDGWIAEVRTYTRALSVADVAALRANLQSRYGL